MKLIRKNLRGRSHRRGIAYAYVILSMVAMMGICSLAVDLGRVMTAKTELRRAADAAARAAAATLSASVSNSTVTTAAQTMAANNYANGFAVSVNSSDVQWGTWNTTTRTFTATTNANTADAVKVITRCTQANGNAVNLTFGMVVGANTCDVTASAVALLSTVAVDANTYVGATSNLWLAGQTTNRMQGSVPDPAYPSTEHFWKYDEVGPYGTTDGTADAYGDPVNEPYASPYAAGFTVTPGTTITITNVSGTASNDSHYAATTTADGSNGGSYSNYEDDAATNSTSPGYTGQSNSGTTTINGTSYSSIVGSEHGIANINTPINSLNGVFLDSNVPDSDGTIPPGLDFSSQTSRDYTDLSPVVKQPFYVGTGQTSSGSQQSIVVPPNATRLFLGTMDGHEWSNNAGGFTVTITESQITIVQ